MAYVIDGQCIACGLCSTVCTKGAITEEETRFRIIAQKCDDCRDCLEVCPIDCIEPSMEDHPTEDKTVETVQSDDLAKPRDKSRG